MLRDVSNDTIMGFVPEQANSASDYTNKPLDVKPKQAGPKNQVTPIHPIHQKSVSEGNS
jgi:hypothetical protein